MQTRRLWTPEEDMVLREKYETCEAADIGQQLGRGATSVYNRAHLLGHENISTTQIYAQTDDVQVKQAHEKFV